jgi:nucleoside-diphosphate-sugar epimerase
MRIAIFGGTGQLGHFTIKHLTERGHECLAIGLGEGPEEGFLPPGTRFLSKNLESSGVEDLVSLLSGYDVVIHATGADGRNVFDKPAIDGFRKANVDTVVALISAMKLAGSKKLVILGSYYTAMDRLHPSLDLGSTSAYIASRKEQGEAAFESAGPEISVAILELPYIFGAAPGRKTLWDRYIQTITAADDVVHVHSGGTACVTMNQVGMAAATACEIHQGKSNYPIGGVNLKYTEIFELFCKHLDKPRTIVAAPNDFFMEKAVEGFRALAYQGKESAYNPVEFLRAQAVDLFIGPGPSMDALSYPAEDISKAIQETVLASWSASNTDHLSLPQERFRSGANNRQTFTSG